MPKVTKIEPTKTLQNRPIDEIRKLKVAAYARVSTELEEQQSSYAAQIKYYTELISRNPNWELVQIYADEGISGTSTKKRTGFNNMIKDAEDGKIDIILTKSISRFARNTGDAIKYVHRLRDCGVEVRFEREHINSMDRNGETTLVVMASMAQEESHSISENVKWGKQRSMANAKVNIVYNKFLGYQKGPDGRPQIVEEEAKIIRHIFDLYLNNGSYSSVARALTAEGILTPTGKSEWKPGTVKSILTNEKYKGDALLGKTFTKDFLSKKVVKNTGQQPQYYVSGSHEAIIDPATFDLVQHEIVRRSGNTASKSGFSPFARILYCNHCKELYGHKIWNSRQTHTYDMWVCNCKSNHLSESWTTCKSANIREEKLRDLSVTAINQIWGKKGEIMANAADKKVIDATRAKQDKKIKEYRKKQEDTRSALAHYIKNGLHANKDFIEYQKTHDFLIQQAEEAKTKLLEYESQCQENIANMEKERRFAEILGSIKQPLTTFDEKLFSSMIEKAVVSRNTITFYFKCHEKVKLEIKG